MNPGGHAQYLAFLRVAGEVFSPMHPLAEPLRRGGRDFWCVEGLWQGSKVLRLADCARAERSGIQFELLQQQQDFALVWFPAAGHVRERFKQSAYFEVLKSGRNHKAARDRVFGLGEWAFAGHYVADAAQLVTDRDLALALIHRPAYHAQLAGHAGDLARLRRLLDEGAVHITPEMREAHPHLGCLLEVLAASL